MKATHRSTHALKRCSIWESRWLPRLLSPAWAGIELALLRLHQSMTQILHGQPLTMDSCIRLGMRTTIYWRRHHYGGRACRAHSRHHLVIYLTPKNTDWLTLSKRRTILFPSHLSVSVSDPFLRESLSALRGTQFLEGVAGMHNKRHDVWFFVDSCLLQSYF